MNDCGRERRTAVTARVGGLIVVAAVAALAAVGFGALGTTGQRSSAFDLQGLGAKQQQLPAVRTKAFTATIAARGYTAGTGRGAVMVSATDAGKGEWTPHTHGAIRRTRFGHETVTLAANEVEQLLISRRQVLKEIYVLLCKTYETSPLFYRFGEVICDRIVKRDVDIAQQVCRQAMKALFYNRRLIASKKKGNILGESSDRASAGTSQWNV